MHAPITNYDENTLNALKQIEVKQLNESIKVPVPICTIIAQFCIPRTFHLESDNGETRLDVQDDNLFINHSCPFNKHILLSEHGFKMYFRFKLKCQVIPNLYSINCRFIPNNRLLTIGKFNDNNNNESSWYPICVVGIRMGALCVCILNQKMNWKMINNPRDKICELEIDVKRNKDGYTVIPTTNDIQFASNQLKQTVSGNFDDEVNNKIKCCIGKSLRKRKKLFIGDIYEVSLCDIDSNSRSKIPVLVEHINSVESKCELCIIC